MSTTPSVPPLRLGPRFDGATYDQELDHGRLTSQLQKVFDVMKDQQWRTLAMLEVATNAPQASISARLRDFRKQKFGKYVLERRRVVINDEPTGLHEYRLQTPEPETDSELPWDADYEGTGACDD